MSEIPILCRVQALYSFQSNDPSSLSFNENDYIDVLSKLPSGWWDGLCNGTRGWFPSNYITVISESSPEDDETPTMSSKLSSSHSNNEYRLSLSYSSNSTLMPTASVITSNTNGNFSSVSASTAATSTSNHIPSGWIPQRTEDGADVYYFNPVTGEMRINLDSDIQLYDEDQLNSSSNNDSNIQSEYEEFDQNDLPSNGPVTRWSDQSIPLSTIEEKQRTPQWIHRAESQQRISVHTSDTQSINSNETPPQLMPQSPMRRSSLYQSSISSETLSWPKLSSTINNAIEQLMTTAKNEQHQLYQLHSNTIVNTIRHMLIASTTIDKDSGYIKANSTLRFHHRAMLSCMSKLSLTGQSCQTFSLNSYDEQKSISTKIITETNELKETVYNYIQTCQGLSIPLTHTDPQWINASDESSSRLSHLTTSTESSGSTGRFSLQFDLAENLESLHARIQESADGLIKDISRCLASFDDSDIEPQDHISVKTLIMAQFQTLSNQTEEFLNYLDNTDFTSIQDQEEVKEILVCKEQLLTDIGLLLCRVQDISNYYVKEFGESLKDIEYAVSRLYDPLQFICTSVYKLESKFKCMSNSNTFLPTTTDGFTKHSDTSETALDLTGSEDEEDYDEFGEEYDEDNEGDDEEGDLLSEMDSTPFHSSRMLHTEDDMSESRPGTAPLERHKSDLPPKFTSSMVGLPPQIRRSQTAPPSKQKSDKQKSDKLKKFFGDDAPLPMVSEVSKPTTPERPEFLRYDYGANDIVFNMEGNVKGGTLPALVERLTLHDYLDMNFISTFLLTYRSFCSSVELLDLLESRYNLQCPPNLNEEEQVVWEEKKLKLVRLRVFNVLKSWLELYYNEDDSFLLDRLYNFTQTHIRTTLKFSNGQLESLIERRRNSNSVDNGPLKKMILTLRDPPDPILPRNAKRFKLLDIDALEMARQMTIMDFKLYSSIKPIECLDKAWSSSEENTAVNVRASIEYCNQVTSWVSDVILSQYDIKKRSNLIKYWVQVAEKCRTLNNFNTCMAILSAFDNSSVGRLKRTWETVGARTTQVLQSIRKLMGANRNFTEYRAFIHSINPPCIPFLGIYLQDLTFIEDGNTNELKKAISLINFAKRAKTAEVIKEIQQYQSSLYPLKAVDELQEFIKSNLKSTRDEEQLYKESLKLEPRERDDEKVSRLLQESGFF